jgi:hypothetical protein
MATCLQILLDQHVPLVKPYLLLRSGSAAGCSPGRSSRRGVVRGGTVFPDHVDLSREANDGGTPKPPLRASGELDEHARQGRRGVVGAVGLFLADDVPSLECAPGAERRTDQRSNA